MAKRLVIVGGKIFRLSVSIDDDKIDLPLSKFGQSLSDFRRFWKEFFAPQFFDDIQANFASEGRFVGGWRSLSPAYAAWKLAHYGPKPILQRRGRMIESLRMGGRGNIVNVTKQQAQFGSSVGYTLYHNRGTSRMPRRIVLFFRDMKTYSRLLATFLREEMEAAGMKARQSA